MEIDDYPPAEHLGRELRIRYCLPASDRIDLRIPVVPEILHADGTVQTEVLTTVLDEATGFLSVFASLPSWGSTAALQMGFTGARVDPGGEVVVEGRVVKAGKRLVFVEADVTVGSALVAFAAAQFAKVPRADRNLEMDLPAPDAEVVFELGLPDSHLPKPYPERLGLRVLDASAGEVELPFGEYVRNSSGILHGGVVGALPAAAAEAASGGRAIQIDASYLSPGRIGPFRTRASRLTQLGDRTVWRVDTLDAGDPGGADDRTDRGRLMNRATVTTVGS